MISVLHLRVLVIPIFNWEGPPLTHALEGPPQTPPIGDSNQIRESTSPSYLVSPLELL